MYLTARQGTKGGNYLAPSTAPGNPYGFLVTGSTLTAAAGTPANLIALGRAWDESVTCYMPGVSPNGQALVRDSVLGPQIRARESLVAGRHDGAPVQRRGEPPVGAPQQRSRRGRRRGSDGGTDAPVK